MPDLELLQVNKLNYPFSVLSATLAAPPGSPAVGDSYIVAASPTGAWAGHALALARWNGTAWLFQSPSVGRVVWNVATSQNLQWNGSAWISDLAIVKESARVFNVGQASWMYPDLASAAAAATAATPTWFSRAVIMVWPGKYISSSPVTIPSWCGVKGVSKGLVQFQNDTTSIFTCSSNTWFEDLLIEGSSNAALYAFNGNNATAVHIRRVDMLNNGGTARQKFMLQQGSSWSVLFIEDCVIDFLGTQDYALFLNNTGSVRFVDANITNVFVDAFHLSTTFGGCFSITKCQDVRIRHSEIRGAGSLWTGVRLQNGGASGAYVDVWNSFIGTAPPGGSGVPVFNESSTTINLFNCHAKGSLTAGTLNTANSTI